MENNSQENNNPQQEERRPTRSLNFWILVFVLGALIAWMLFGLNNLDYSRISYSYLVNLIDGKDFSGKQLQSDECPVERVEFFERGAYGTFYEGKIPPPEPVRKTDGSIDKDRVPPALKRNFMLAWMRNRRSTCKRNCEMPKFRLTFRQRTICLTTISRFSSSYRSAYCC